MNTIIIAILFIIPGLMASNIEKRLYAKTKEKESDYVTRYNFFIDSAVIFIISIVFTEFLYLTKIPEYIKNINLHGLFLEGFSLKLFILYFLWTMIISYPYVKLKRLFVKKLFLSISNSGRKKNNLPQETAFSSVWDEIFENAENPIDEGQIIIIQKEDKVITQGYIKSYSPPNLNKREFLLEETSSIKKFLEVDAELNEEEKLLNVIDKEYFDTQTGITIKFVNPEKLVKYLSNLEKSD